MDDDSDDAELWAAAELASAQQTSKPVQPAPQRVEKRTAVASSSSSSVQPKVIQPTPQALPQRSSGSTILVSPRQRGNPVLASIKSTAWEYSDIPCDFQLGLTTCALFLSLKYHRLHPEYIYSRITNLQGRYNLRVVLALVDITNHEDSLKELAKASLVNNVTLICCWSAAEAARYLELYKSYENASFKAIQGHQGSTYVERLVEFATVLRGVNKTDAVSLVSSFGSLKNAINADAEQIGIIGGWGEVKVKRWCGAVQEPFRTRKVAPRDGETRQPLTDEEEVMARLQQATFSQATPLRDMAGGASGSAPNAAASAMGQAASAIRPAGPTPGAARVQDAQSSAESKPEDGVELSAGVASALARLRQQAGQG